MKRLLAIAGAGVVLGSAALVLVVIHYRTPRPPVTAPPSLGADVRLHLSASATQVAFGDAVTFRGTVDHVGGDGLALGSSRERPWRLELADTVAGKRAAYGGLRIDFQPDRVSAVEGRLEIEYAAILPVPGDHAFRLRLRGPGKAVIESSAVGILVPAPADTEAEVAAMERLLAANVADRFLAPAEGDPGWLAPGVPRLCCDRPAVACQAIGRLLTGGRRRGLSPAGRALFAYVLGSIADRGTAGVDGEQRTTLAADTYLQLLRTEEDPLPVYIYLMSLPFYAPEMAASPVTQAAMLAELRRRRLSPNENVAFAAYLDLLDRRLTPLDAVADLDLEDEIRTTELLNGSAAEGILLGELRESEVVP